MRAPLIAFAALLCSAACSSPDNLMDGGILGAGAVPNATIPTVGSALSGMGMITDESGDQSPRAIILLSDQSDLCATLAADPQFLSTPTTSFTILALTVPPGDEGTFYAGAVGTEAGLFASGSAGGPVYGYPGLSGTIVVDEFDTRAQGTFDLEVADLSANEYEVYGQFKTEECDAIAGMFLPEVGLEQ